MSMFTFGTTVTTTSADMGLFAGSTSTPISGGRMFPASALIVAPLTILDKVTCVFCDNPLQSNNYMPKTGDQKLLEDIALEHFIRKILRADEEYLGENSVIFPEDINGAMHRKLLSSVKLCEGCIFHFAKNEEAILKDQLEFLGKMSGMRDFGEVLADPWLDIKRFAFAKLKCQEPTIKEKLQVMSRLFPSVDSSLKIIFTTPTTENCEASTSSGNTDSNIGSTQHILLTPVNCPMITDSSNGVASMDISEQVTSQHEDQQPAATCQFAVTSERESSDYSSGATSPNPAIDKHNESSNVSIKTTLEENDDANATITANSIDKINDKLEVDVEKCPSKNTVEETHAKKLPDADQDIIKESNHQQEQVADADEEEDILNPQDSDSSKLVIDTDSEKSGSDDPNVEFQESEENDDDEDKDEEYKPNASTKKEPKKTKKGAKRKRNSTGKGNKPKRKKLQVKSSVDKTKAAITADHVNIQKINNCQVELELLPFAATPSKDPESTTITATPDPISTSKAKESLSSNGTFVTPSTPKRKGKLPTPESDTKKKNRKLGNERKSLSVVGLARKTLGNENVKEIGRSSQQSSPVTPGSTKSKKMFKIGNRYLTESSSSSSDDDSDDSVNFNIAGHTSDGSSKSSLHD